MHINEMVELFKTKAELVSATVTEIKTLKEAYEYTVDLCEKKQACQLLVSGCEENLSSDAEALCETKPTARIIAAPGLRKNLFSEFKKLADDRSIMLIDSGLRKHLGGIDIGFTIADYAIADTGSVVLDSGSEDLRLATMVSEIHVAVVRKSTLRANSVELEEELKALMVKDGKSPSYLAFISGASRTADIERVLALGVHGPLEMHILLWEDKK